MKEMAINTNPQKEQSCLNEANGGLYITTLTLARPIFTHQFAKPKREMADTWISHMVTLTNSWLPKTLFTPGIKMCLW